MTSKAKEERHVGGRGNKAEIRYARFSATLHPDLLNLLDAHAEARGISRSQMLAVMVEHYAKARPVKGISLEEVSKDKK